MISRVCNVLENMVYEFTDLRRKELFSESEIKSILNKRRHHEYTINSSMPMLINYILYLEFEMSLENLRVKRLEKKKEDLLNEIAEYTKLIKTCYTDINNFNKEILNTKCPKEIKMITKKINSNENHIKQYKNNIAKVEKKIEVLLQHSVSDNSLVKRIIQIFQKCLKKNYNNIQIWLLYFNFCFLKNKKDELEKAILTSLKYHMNNELIWMHYLYYFYNIRKNILYTRKLYIRAMLFVPNSLYLNALYFIIEFDIFFKLLTNFKYQNDNSNNVFNKNGNDQFDDFCKDQKKNLTNELDENNQANKSENDILKMNIDEKNEQILLAEKEQKVEEFNYIKDEDKYGLDVLIFLGKRYIHIFEKNKSNLHIFIILLLNIFFKMEKNEWVKNYVLQYEDFKNLILNSIENNKFDQPCFYYYLFINKCTQIFNIDTLEDNDFILMKKSFYACDDKDILIKIENIKKYFNHSLINQLLIETFNSFDNELMIYLFCLLLENIFQSFSEYDDISDVFKIDNVNDKTTVPKKNDSSSDIILESPNNSITHNPDLINLQNGNKKDILFHMKEPTLPNHENLEIFKFLKDEIFLCDSNHKFYKINMEYIKEKDKDTYNFLQKLNFIPSVCLFENRSLSITPNNHIYNFEQNNKNADIMSSLLYFFLFDMRNIKENQTNQSSKNNSIYTPPDSINSISKKRKTTNKYTTLGSLKNKKAKKNIQTIKLKSDKNGIFESDSDNMSDNSDDSDSSNSASQDNEYHEKQESIKIDKIDINKKETNDTKKDIFIIDELLSLLSREIDVFVKMTIIKTVLKLITFLNNDEIAKCLFSKITKEYHNIKSSTNSMVKKGIASLVQVYDKVYKDFPAKKINK
ncbi:U3 small nucleolar RNA-associated protein 6, putative [Plasmodium vinckei]|uniref:U3 small nucleolar RNA-associated protein 6, putative n=1 Tax=Plasmodium vinckei TaxID=5860 RepID=A0A6V7TDD3_PLAVN|nr:U3 small nucleolar RNA-associated protein 6, putative [Plasmodium vinckei]